MGILKLRGFMYYGNLPLNVGKSIVEIGNIGWRKVVSITLGKPKKMVIVFERSLIIM